MSASTQNSPSSCQIAYQINVFASVVAKTPTKSFKGAPAEIAASLQKIRTVERKELAPLLTFVRYRPGAKSRGTSDIVSAHVVNGDIDADFDEAAFESGLTVLERAGAQVIAYQTYGHTPAAPRWRIFVFLDEPVSPADYRACWEGLNVIFNGMLDGNAKDCARLNYWPSCPPGQTRVVRTLNISPSP